MCFLPSVPLAALVGDDAKCKARRVTSSLMEADDDICVLGDDGQIEATEEASAGIDVEAVDSGERDWREVM